MDKVFLLDAGWRTLLRDMGVSHEDVLRGAQLPEDLLSRPQAALDSPSYFRFWSALEKLCDDPMFSLRLIGSITTEVFSPPIFAALCSPTLEVAARRLADYKKLLAPMAIDISLRADGVLGISPHWLDKRLTPPLSMVVAELAFFLRLARLATREPVCAVHVSLPALPQPLAAFEAFFGCPVRKGPPCISFNAADAQKPFLTASETMWQTFEPALRKRLSELEGTATLQERVRAALLEQLPGGQATLAQVASRLALSPRSLQRRLAQTGPGFQNLVHEVRRELALHYLQQTPMTNGEIAFLLGYEDLNSFYRAFRAWTGRSPDGVRALRQT